MANKMFHAADQDWIEEILGRGAGDPDIHGYPGEGGDDEN